MHPIQRLAGAIFILAALATAAAGASAAGKPAERTLETVMAGLAKGGCVILMRHANSPTDQIGSVGMTQGCILQAGRGLDAKGFFQARFIGEFLTSNHAPIGAAYTSDMCRCWDTARLVAAGGAVAPEPALKTTNVGEIDIFKMKVAAWMKANPKTNVLLVTHSNIVPLYAGWTSTEEIPSGVVLIVDPKTWKIKDKINMDFELSVDGQ